MDKTKIRDAATVILYRNPTAPEILMGQRGARAAFMPNKFVFPGGAVDAGDADIPLAGQPDALCRSRLAEECARALPHALLTAAIREIWEETGLILGTPGDWPRPAPDDWQSFAATGHLPDASALRFIFRAVTPPGRPRRFDARFFLASTDGLASDPDDFSRASDELSNLQWIPLRQARSFDLPFITEVVLAEVAALITRNAPPESVPFFNNDDEESLFQRLKGQEQGPTQ
ncbi:MULTISPECIES: NUDIX hydrolase [unclassified Meridianimarinicoccus]|uniref:NUDIX hydrolase n=1 Tax=unclassified Meridianimarinicoccus TaxID=2923344 RepID=UPI001D01DC25|nr:NUDIX hydrolase [Fluviibacterium sp. MJW13]